MLHLFGWIGAIGLLWTIGYWFCAFVMLALGANEYVWQRDPNSVQARQAADEAWRLVGRLFLRGFFGFVVVVLALFAMNAVGR